MHDHAIWILTFALKNCLFEGIKLAKNGDPNKNVYSPYGIGFNSHSIHSGSVDKNVIIFGVDMSSLIIKENIS